MLRGLAENTNIKGYKGRRALLFLTMLKVGLIRKEYFTMSPVQDSCLDLLSSDAESITEKLASQIATSERESRR